MNVFLLAKRFPKKYLPLSLYGQIILSIIASLYFYQSGTVTFFVSLMPILMLESLVYLKRSWIGIAIILSLEIISWILVWSKSGLILAILYFEIYLFIILIVYFYWRSYRQSVYERVALKKAYDEQAIAQSQIDEMLVKSERDRIARDLHDTLLQDVTGLSLQLEVLEQVLNRGELTAAQNITSKVSLLAKKTIVESRKTLTNLHEQKNVSSQDLEARLKVLSDVFAHRYHLQVKLKFDGSYKLPAMISQQIISVISEALMNVVKHTDGELAIIRVGQKNGTLHITVIDFGPGFEVKKGKQKIAHFGLAGMMSRMADIGGRVTIDSQPGEGSRVDISLPMEKIDEDFNR
ncbi:Signal transduction histidine kinase ComP (ComP) [Eupransor demetentiae]|uniref:histidine kinase n=2 Tax=Eupransor demetentiae TaxID=3109584 RepID=A0ABM9N471_9LACO|nr:Signal transduction histidine kinase ComP (ComP) [Lactobacillaceae bacterium LMG 33000]